MTKRWEYQVLYRIDATTSFVKSDDIEELMDIHDIVEHGPDWATIEEIRIHYNGEARCLTPAELAQL